MKRSVEFGDAGILNEIRIADGTSPFETVYQFSDFTEDPNDTSLPRHVHLFLQRSASGERPASTHQEIVEITLNSAVARSAEAAEFSPDLNSEGNVTDYRKSLPKLRKDSGRLLENSRDFIGF